MVSTKERTFFQASQTLIRSRFLAVICAFVLCGVLTAGLWPFHHPKNDVTWLPSGNGVHFGRRATILSAGPLSVPNPEPVFSLEIWLKSDLPWNDATLLSFYAPNSSVQLSMRQWNAGLLLQAQDGASQFRTTKSRMYVANVFLGRKPVFITITSATRGTTVYVDGARVGTSTEFLASDGDAAVQLVVGDSPFKNDSWFGQLKGLAIYNSALTAAQVSRHHAAWTERGSPDESAEERGVAIYLFNEHEGRLIHNLIPSGVDLEIPIRYVLLNETFLEPAWKEFKLSRSYWKSVLINIVGLIPLGFVFCAYLSSIRQIQRAALVTVVLGFAVSLIIEVLQAYLPTRDSGTTDLITNTLGTYFGVLLYKAKSVRDAFNEGLDHIVIASQASINALNRSASE